MKKHNPFPTGSIWEHQASGDRVIVTGRVGSEHGGEMSEIKISLLSDDMPDLTGVTAESELRADFKRVDEHQEHHDLPALPTI